MNGALDAGAWVNGDDAVHIRAAAVIDHRLGRAQMICRPLLRRGRRPAAFKAAAPAPARPRFGSWCTGAGWARRLAAGAGRGRPPRPARRRGWRPDRRRSLREYWVVDPERELVFVYVADNKKFKPTIPIADDYVYSTIFPDFKIHTSDLFHIKN